MSELEKILCLLSHFLHCCLYRIETLKQGETGHMRDNGLLVRVGELHGLFEWNSVQDRTPLTWLKS